jgi:outer membrane receptor protein involved in Fe transport
MRQPAGVDFNYENPAIDTVQQRVTFHGSRTPLGRALGYVLRGTGLIATPYDSEIVIVKRAPPASIVGHVVDSRSGAPIASATVVISDLWHRTSTSDSGSYRLDSVPDGTFQLSVRSIGYRGTSRTVTVTASLRQTIDLPLDQFSGSLERVVVTGTIVPTEVRDLPTPISVITSTDIQQQHYEKVDDIFRGQVPGSIAWDQGVNDYFSTITVRGINSFDVNNIKTYIDGVEVADPAYAAVDMDDVDHIEILRGPEASTIYGSDASGGVMQIFTKHGQDLPSHPTVNISVQEGVVQNPTLNAGTLEQRYEVSTGSGSADASYNLGASYRHVDGWIPGYYSSDPAAYGGIHIDRGAFSVDLSGRYLQRDFPLIYPPALAATGILEISNPQYVAQQEHEQTFGAHLGYQATAWWNHSLTVGYDRYEFEQARTRRVDTTASDTAQLLLFDQAVGKASIAYNTSAAFSVSRSLRSNATLGFDHYDRTVNVVSADSLTSVIGVISAGSATLDRDPVSNTGLFGQVQVGAWDALFLTAGIRADWNTGIGPQYGEAVAPRFGASLVRSIGLVTVKARAEYGAGIQPGSPSEARSQTLNGITQLANPALGPERQEGGDVGVDLEIGRFGVLDLTYYDQLARDLIQDVFLGNSNNTPTLQYQNVGRIRNSGLEVQGSLSLHPVQIDAEFSYTASKIVSLGPNYSGDYRVGDQALLVPRTSGGARLRLPTWRGATLGFGVTYVGYWTSYNFISADSGIYGKAMLKPLRDYWMRFPAFAKLKSSLDQRLNAHATAFVSVENLADNRAVEQNALYIAPGRTTTLGVRVQW